MPWYRTDDGQHAMHILMCRGRGKARPWGPCRAEALPGDNLNYGPQCGRQAGKLCDAPLTPEDAALYSGRSRVFTAQMTCDMPLCAKHATHVEGKDLDYCPRHAHLASADHDCAAWNSGGVCLVCRRTVDVCQP
jgi:hypothetical protein